MINPFSPFPKRKDGIHVSLGAPERSILTDLLQQLITLIQGGDTSDAAMTRLFPAAYADDEEASAEFRRLTGDDLAQGKVENAKAVLRTLGKDRKVPLDTSEEQAWLRTLTDLRLTLASRLGVTPDGTIPAKDAATRVSENVYDWLGFLQESLVRTLVR
ncbi:DUF2017 domain-containing protein [Frondihabitans cladoniiphilus]|uniref:DUF2017 domain-containing protein n=1 Tax=Frondihabitans cladoniiphilus TaxID=715785 RepID=A0ABP8VX41_9MICO